MIPVICIDPDCPKYGKKELVKGRFMVFDHIRKLRSDDIIHILQKYGLNFDFKSLTYMTLANIFADYCYERNARKLLGGYVFD